ncbi:receptor-like protein 9DC3 [Impatiens glandulifera]|uniref:receptor-like protein 9DC3 n=1 Tax=Impatiens glandulifera TaxID=253017 RepID=UPI001FB05ACD|nr:receptor-like protein 9DC3 [Impatiens glandulifera]
MSNMRIFRASNNKIKGEIPSSICNISSLELLDLSQNELEGLIHQCLGNFSATLSVLDLRMNHFHGGIPAIYAKDNMLRTLAFNGNQLQGPIPRSISLCINLQVIDLGNNMIKGTFPSWLDALPELQVLVLRSNRLHGFVDMNSEAQSPFLKLHIFDISRNQFTGPFPSWYFNNFYAMKTVNRSSTGHELYMGKEYNLYQYSDGSYTYHYRDSVTITTKGLDAHLQGISFPRTTIDLSSNKFEGSIPDVVGNLVALTMLNMSNNRLTGPIPESLGNLVHLESLDLSSNHLTGEIPQELTSITFLEVLNLSCNGLEGRIPQGKQFDTFLNTSYMENKGLCGPPLSRKCQGHEMETPPPPPPPPPHDDSEDDSYFAFSGFTWQAVLTGYIFGMIIGLAAGCLSFSTGRPKWFATMIDEEVYKIMKKYRRGGRVPVRRIPSSLRLP